MFRSVAAFLGIGASALLLAGCFNLPTAPQQITGTYTSTIKYEQFDCARLTVELDSLSRREAQLVAAQEERRSSGKIQAFWLGFGQGDGVEASELAQVRGESEAVRKTMGMKTCEVAKPITAASPAPAKTSDCATRVISAGGKAIPKEEQC
jgi:hypothetical protein